MISLKDEWNRIRLSMLARNAGWMFVGQGTGLLLQAVCFAVLARLLGALEYGIFAGAFAFVGLVAQYSTLGTGTVLLRYVPGNRKIFGVYWGNVLLVTLVLGSVLTLVLHLLGRHLLNPASAALVVLAAIANCFCAQLITETARVFQAFEEMRLTAALNLLTNFMRTMAAGTMMITMHHATAWQWSVVSLCVSIIPAGTSVVLISARYGRPRFAPKLFARHGLEGAGYSFAWSTASVYNDLDKTMLSHYGMNLANGIYTTAYRIIDMATIPLFAMRDAAMPRLFQLGRSGLSASSGLSLRLLKRALPISACAAAVIFLGAPLLPHVVGHGFAESVVALRWLCFIPILRSVHQMSGCALTGAGLQRYRTAAQFTAALFNFGLNVWMIPAYGWRGAAWSSLMTDGALACINWALMKVLIAIQRGPEALSHA
jgi:O-antigen/teichoic acid export membrane protein